MANRENQIVWRVLVGLLVTCAGLTAVGCHHRAPVISARRMARYEQRLLRLAARDTGCNAAQLAPQQLTSGPAVFTVTGCTTPVEYWLRCGRRGRRCRWLQVPSLQQQAAQALQCPPQNLQLQMTQAPNSRYATGCGRTAPFTIQCNPSACGWAAGPIQAAGGGLMVVPQQEAQQQVVVQQQPQQSAATVTVPPPPGQAQPQAQASGPGVNLQSQVQGEREAILSCVDSGQINLSLRWTADGQVIVQLPPELAGTAAEGCIQAAVGSLRIQAQQPGEVSISLR